MRNELTGCLLLAEEYGEVFVREGIVFDFGCFCEVWSLNVFEDGQTACLRPYSTLIAHLLFFLFTNLEYGVSDKRKVAEASVTRGFVAYWLRTELAPLATVLCWELTSHWLSITSVSLFKTTAPKLCPVH